MVPATREAPQGMSGPVLAHRWVISGRVQGVGFRWAASRRADQIGVTGWVRNLGDGSVEVAAAGTEDQLAALDAFLRDGPRYANVENVEKSVIPLEAIGSNSFEIR